MITANQTGTSSPRLDPANWKVIERQLQQVHDDKQQEQPNKGYLCCSHCRLRITQNDQRIAVQGSHEHVYNNPGGIVFHIGCFAAAPGCQAVGVPTQEWTWFRGFAWQVALCKGCGVHLGWRYTSPDADKFHGLILARLAPASDPHS